MIELKRSNSSDENFIQLVSELDAYLANVDGDDHDFYNQFNGIDSIEHVVLAYYNSEPAGCGAIKPFDAQRMEVKRMYTRPELRGKGIAALVLIELENWCSELGGEACLLETGINQQDAIRVYQKNGYLRVENYGQYVGVENSFCFEKKVPSETRPQSH